MKTQLTLGIIALETPPDLFPGSLHHPDTFQFAVVSELAKGIGAGDIVDDPSHAEQSIVDAAVALVEQGATHITSNCGFTVLYLDALRQAVEVPVFVSSLQLLPTLACGIAGHKKIGILTYDAHKLSNRHFLAALGRSYDPDNYIVRGLEGTSAWVDWKQAFPEYDFDTARRDILDSAIDVSAHGPACIVLECEVMIPFADVVRAETRLPVFDLVSSLRFLLGLH